MQSLRDYKPLVIVLNRAKFKTINRIIIGNSRYAYCENILKLHYILSFYLTIRLRARDFYEVIVDEGEARINYHLIEIESE